MARKTDSDHESQDTATPSADIVGGELATRTTRGENTAPEFIENDDGSFSPNPDYVQTARQNQGKYNPQKIYRFVYIGPSLHHLPEIRHETIKKDGKELTGWVETGADIVLRPGLQVEYLGWIANRNPDFVEPEPSAVTRSWKFPWSEKTIINRFKMVPPELFDDFVQGYFKVFKDRRQAVQEFYFETSQQHKESIQARQGASF